MAVDINNLPDDYVISNMQSGRPYYFNMAEIWLINEIYFLFEISRYGGLPKFISIYNINQIDKMVKEYKSWT